MAVTALLTGGCLCNSVRFTATPMAMKQDACHCRMCRRWVGGPFLSVQCGESVKVENENALLIHPSSDWAERVSCASCGSALFWRLRKAGGSTAVATGAFDDDSVFPLSDEIFVDEQPATYAFANKTHRMTGPEVVAAYQASQGG